MTIDWTNDDTINDREWDRHWATINTMLDCSCMLAGLEGQILTKSEARALDAIYDRVHALEVRVGQRVSKERE